MSNEGLELQLLTRLQSMDALSQRGLTAEIGDAGGVVIYYSRHARGIWHHDKARFRYTPAGYGVPTHQAETVEDAVRITLALI